MTEKLNDLRNALVAFATTFPFALCPSLPFPQLYIQAGGQ